jgi:hypothetical protein
MPGKKVGRGRQRNLDAGVLQPMVSRFELHLRAEKKSPKTIRTYKEAEQWLPAGSLIKVQAVRAARSKRPLHLCAVTARLARCD